MIVAVGLREELRPKRGARVGSGLTTAPALTRKEAVAAVLKLQNFIGDRGCPGLVLASAPRARSPRVSQDGAHDGGQVKAPSSRTTRWSPTCL